VVICEFCVLLWSKPFTFKLKFWIWTKPNKNGVMNGCIMLILGFKMQAGRVLEILQNMTSNMRRPSFPDSVLRNHD
jgi:hypothetical protein